MSNPTNQNQTPSSNQLDLLQLFSLATNPFDPKFIKFYEEVFSQTISGTGPYASCFLVGLIGGFLCIGGFVMLILSQAQNIPFIGDTLKTEIINNPEAFTDHALKSIK